MHYSWKLAGEAGFGVTTIGYAFTKLCARQGFYAYDYAEFPSLIRGGFTTHEVSLSDRPFSTLTTQLDMLIALRQDGFDRDKHRLDSSSVVIYDDQEVHVEGDFLAIPMPYRAIKLQHHAYQVMVNTVSIGATFALFDWEFDLMKKMIADDFAKKGQEVIDFNEALAKAGWDEIQKLTIDNEQLKTKKAELKARLAPPLEKKPKLVMTGNDAFAYGSVMAGAGAYCAYPMSPSTTVLTTLAAWQPKTGMIVRHVEDEISAINQALGFSFAGARSATGTSGGGFALMVEAISYAGCAEIPIVIFLAQRPGPATGLPTWTAQGDLLFAVHGGHGEFPRIILAPGDVAEMIELTVKAYDLADLYQTPVIVLSDKLLSESHDSVDEPWIRALQATHQINRGKIVTQTTQEKYLRYYNSPDGISELLIPGVQPGTHWQANSYEHLEDSHTTEVDTEVNTQIHKRARKSQIYLGTHPHDLGERYIGFEMPQYSGSPDAHIVFVSWGGTKAIVEAAQAELIRQGITTGCYHFTHVYPLHPEKIKSLFQPHIRYILVEHNSEGQLGKLLAQEAGVIVSERILKYDGRPITAAEISHYILFP